MVQNRVPSQKVANRYRCYVKITDRSTTAGNNSAPAPVFLSSTEMSARLNRTLHLTRRQFRIPRRDASSALPPERSATVWGSELTASHPAPAKEDPPSVSVLPTTAWTRLGLHDEIATNLVHAGLHTPTKIQTLGLRALLPGDSALLGAETGAGKTLAYLTPLLTLVRTAETDGVPRLPRRPRMLVLAPTRELVEQTRQAGVLAARGLASVRSFTGGPTRKQQQRALGAAPADVLVATPAALGRLRKDRSVFLSNVRHVVFDEADVLLRRGAGFCEHLDPLLVSLRATADRTESQVQFAFAAASVPRSLRERLAAWPGGSVSVAETDRLHCAPGARLRAEFVRVGGGERKKFARCAEIVAAELKENGAARVMVFCDGHERREALAELLRRELDEPVAHASGGNERDMDSRAAAWDAFRGSDGEARVAVCAQSYGRGIDHRGVRAVVLVDVPMTGTEYMHRVGRIRGEGRVSVLVSRRERPVAAALFLATVRGEAVAGVTAQRARVELPGGLPSPLREDDRRAVRAARRSKSAFWTEAEAPRGMRRRRR